MNRSPLHNKYRANETPLPWRARAVAAERAIPASPWDSSWSKLALASRRAWESTLDTCGAFEWIAVGYLAVSSILIASFAENVPHPLRLIALQIVVATIILSLCRFENRICAANSCASPLAQKLWHFWRHWYPHLFFLFCFEELAHLVHLITPGWQDPKLIATDFWLTGVHPTVWLERFATPARNDFMQFAYITYFTYLLVVGGVLYRRKDWRAYWSVMTYSAVAYAIGYVIAISFPDPKPVVLHGRLLARRTSRRRLHFVDQLHRALRSRSRRRVSLGARRWLFRCTLGSLAPSPLAVLDYASASPLHVHLNGLRPLSLCSGCLRRDHNRHARLRNRLLANAQAPRRRPTHLTKLDIGSLTRKSSKKLIQAITVPNAIAVIPTAAGRLFSQPLCKTLRAPLAPSLILSSNSPPLKNPLLTPQIPKRSNIRDNKRHAKLIVGTHLPQRNPPVLQRQPAATPVVTDLH